MKYFIASDHHQITTVVEGDARCFSMNALWMQSDCVLSVTTQNLESRGSGRTWLTLVNEKDMDRVGTGANRKCGEAEEARRGGSVA